MKVLLYLYCILLLGLLSFKKAEPKKVQFNGYAQGTTYSVIYYAEGQPVTKLEVDSLLRAIDLSMSIYIPNSLISRFNQYDTQEIVVDKHFKNVVQESLRLNKISNGIFDITIAPLAKLWGFGTKKVVEAPQKHEVDSVLQYVGSDKIGLTGNKLYKKAKGVTLDVNGIAQGYSVDVIADFLAAKGIKQYLIEVGGELRVKGPKPDGSNFKVGVEQPEGPNSIERHLNAIVELKLGAITTAGNYRKFIESNHQKLSHHINPRTGYPYVGEIISATIVAKNAMLADGYDNIIIAMTAKEALAYTEKNKDIEIYIIYKDASGNIKTAASKGFQKLFVN